jgi:alkylated DNA repair dioxygenase AlkB
MKLPLNCTAEYFSDFLSPKEADQLFHYLISHFDLSNFEIKLPGGASFWTHYGKLTFLEDDIIHGNKMNPSELNISSVWTEPILPIKKRVEALTGRIFGVGVCIHYPDGHSGVDYHDDRPNFGDTTVLPSLSLGEEREFCLREKATGEVYSLTLKNGSLLVMGEHCQERYEHALPENPKYKNPRINITFRQFGNI